MEKRVKGLLDRQNELEEKQAMLKQHLKDCTIELEATKEEITKITHYCEAISGYYSSCGAKISEADLALIIQSVEKFAARDQRQKEVGVATQDARVSDKRKRDQLDILRNITQHGNHDSPKKIKMDAHRASTSGQSGSSEFLSEYESSQSESSESTSIEDYMSADDSVAEMDEALEENPSQEEENFNRRLTYLEKVLMVVQEISDSVDGTDLDKKNKALLDVECARKNLNDEMGRFLTYIEKQNHQKCQNKVIDWLENRQHTAKNDENKAYEAV